MTESPHGTLGAMWRDAIAAPRPFPAFLVRERAEWRPVGWDAAGERVERVAAGLLEAGVARGERVAIVVPTRMEWTICDYALHSIGAIPVPLYTTVSPADAGHVLADSGARLALVAAAQYRDLHGTLATAGVEPVLVGEAADGLRTLDGLAEAGAALLRQTPDAVTTAGAPVTADDVASIVYTSGTTGPPKGCVLTHGNLRAMTELVADIPGLLREGETVLLFLPLAHSFARLMQNLAVRVGITIAYCPDLRSVPSALTGVRPHILPSVPRAYELLYRQIQGQLAEQRGPARAVAGWAVGVGRRAERRRGRGQGRPPWLAAEHAVADRLVFARLRRRMGGRLRLAIAGGAPLSEPVGEFLAAVGLHVYEGYGMTEATTASHFNLPGHHRFGTVGRVLPRIEARIAADGEVQLRGPTMFQGYHGDPEATRAAFTADGWLRTGDLGREDADGYLRITGRRKDLIVTSGGENVAPLRIEQALTADPLISQALVLGDRRPYLVALLTLDPGEQHRRRLDRPAAEAAVAALVRRVNATLGDAEQIRRHAVLDEEFSAARDEVTPTLKLRREQCEAHNAEVVGALYAARRSRAGGCPAGGRRRRRRRPGRSQGLLPHLDAGLALGELHRDDRPAAGDVRLPLELEQREDGAARGGREHHRARGVPGDDRRDDQHPARPRDQRARPDQVGDRQQDRARRERAQRAEQAAALGERRQRARRRDGAEHDEPVAERHVGRAGRRMQRPVRRQPPEQPVGDPERAPRAVHGRGQHVAGAVRPQPGGELRDPAEDGGEREQEERGGRRVAVPAREVRSDHERRPREAEQAEHGRRGDRLQEDAGGDPVPVPHATGVGHLASHPGSNVGSHGAHRASFGRLNVPPLPGATRHQAGQTWPLRP